MELNIIIIYALLLLNGIFAGVGSFLGQALGKRVYTNIRKVIKKNEKR